MNWMEIIGIIIFAILMIIYYVKNKTHFLIFKKLPRYYYFVGTLCAIFLMYLGYNRGFNIYVILLLGLGGLFILSYAAFVLFILIIITSPIAKLFYKVTQHEGYIIIRTISGKKKIIINEYHSIFLLAGRYWFIKNKIEFDQMIECIHDKAEPPIVTQIQNNYLDKSFLQELKPHKCLDVDYWTKN